MSVCRFCGADNEDWMRICQECGNPIVDTSKEENNDNEKVDIPYEVTETKPKGIRGLVITLIVLIIILIILFIIAIC